jgi:transcriptional regulator with XRE-family HTH domain
VVSRSGLVPVRRQIRRKVPAEERFWPKVQKTETCWLWMGGKTLGGYGVFRYNDRQEGAHRVSWQMAHKEPIPERLQVLHSCDVRLCVNPDHLWLGTQSDNIQDCLAKGRLRPAYGERAGTARYSDQTLFTILDLLAEGKTPTQIETMTGVSRNYVSGFHRGRYRPSAVKMWKDQRRLHGKAIIYLVSEGPEVRQAFTTQGLAEQWAGTDPLLKITPIPLREMLP